MCICIYIYIYILSRWLRYHGIKWQSVVLPNGMVADIYGPGKYIEWMG